MKLERLEPTRELRGDFNSLARYLEQFYDAEERLESFLKQKFYSLEIELTNTCNQECLYCYNWSIRQSKKKPLPFETAMKIVVEAARAGVKELSWLGGEPLTYQRLRPVLERAKSLGLKNTLLTNGTLLNAENWNYLQPLIDRLVIHLDTTDLATFCKLNNVSEKQGEVLLNRTVSALRLVEDTKAVDGLDVLLYVVLTKPSFATLRDTLSWALEERLVDTTALYPMVSAGRALGVKKDWPLSLEEIQEAFEIRASLEKRPELLMLGPSEYYKHYQTTMSYINVEGRISPYAGIDEPSFSIIEDSIPQILDENYEALSFSSLGGDTLTDNLEDPCKSCRFSQFCFGTRTTAFNHSGSIFAADPFCWHASKSPRNGRSSDSESHDLEVKAKA